MELAVLLNFIPFLELELLHIFENKFFRRFFSLASVPCKIVRNMTLTRCVLHNKCIHIYFILFKMIFQM